MESRTEQQEGQGRLHRHIIEQREFKEEIDALQEKIKKGEEEQHKFTQTLKEVDKRKEEEFRAFREQMKKERSGTSTI